MRSEPFARWPMMVQLRGWKEGPNVRVNCGVPDTGGTLKLWKLWRGAAWIWNGPLKFPKTAST